MRSARRNAPLAAQSGRDNIAAGWAGVIDDAGRVIAVDIEFRSGRFAGSALSLGGVAGEAGAAWLRVGFMSKPYPNRNLTNVIYSII